MACGEAFTNTAFQKAPQLGINTGRKVAGAAEDEEEKGAPGQGAEDPRSAVGAFRRNWRKQEPTEGFRKQGHQTVRTEFQEHRPHGAQWVRRDQLDVLTPPGATTSLHRVLGLPPLPRARASSGSPPLAVLRPQHTLRTAASRPGDRDPQRRRLRAGGHSPGPGSCAEGGRVGEEAERVQPGEGGTNGDTYAGGTGSDRRQR